jgi:hypothetical protein
MDKITLKYTFDELTTLSKVLVFIGKNLNASAEMELRMKGVIINRIAQKMIAKLARLKNKYTCNLNIDEAMCLYTAIDKGIIYSRNQWTQQLITNTFNRFEEVLEPQNV